MFGERIQEVEDLGLEFIPKYNSYCLEDLNIGMIEIQTMDTFEWDKLINELKTIIKDRKEIR